MQYSMDQARIERLARCFPDSGSTLSVLNASKPEVQVSLDGLADGTIMSSVTDITVYDASGVERAVRGLPAESAPISFGIEVPSAPATVGDPNPVYCARRGTCSYYDRSSNKWSSEGCRTVSMSASTSGSNVGGSTIRCECTHLTEFAILARDATSCKGLRYAHALITVHRVPQFRVSMCRCVSDTERAVYGVFGLFYFFLMIAAGIQLGRIGWYLKKKFK